MKKGQTEMIGLLVIVMLLMGLGIIFIKLSTSGQGNGLDELRSNIETSNLLKALLKVDREGVSVGDMIIECSVDNSECNELRSLIPEIINSALKPGSSYKFEASSENRVFLELGSCDGQGIVSNQPYVKQGVFIENKLKLC